MGNFTPEDVFLNEAQAANMIGFSKNTLRVWRVNGRSNGEPTPIFIKCGRAVRYRLSDLKAWMNSMSAKKSTSDPGTPCHG